MDEIYSLTDQITVLRDGKLIGSIATADVTPDKLINMMVGRELNNVYVKSAEKTADFDESEVLLRVEHLTRENEFYNVDFEVRRGEILGFFGLMGAGRTEVMDTLFGLRKADKGSVTMKGQKLGTVKKAVSYTHLGIGEYVIVAQGSAARIGCDMEEAPVDAAIVGIIDDGGILEKDDAGME